MLTINLILLFFLLVPASCGVLSGEKKLLEKDVSGLREVEFSLKISKSWGHASKHILIRVDGVDILCKMTADNRGRSEHRMTWTKEVKGKRLGGDLQLKAKENKEIYNGSSGRLGFIIYDLEKKKSDILIKIVFSEKLPENTTMVVRAVWADGP